MKKNLAILTCAMMLVCSLLSAVAIAEESDAITLSEILAANGVNMSEFSSIEVVPTYAAGANNTRSGRNGSAVILTGEDVETGENKSAFVIVYTKDMENVTPTTVTNSNARGSSSELVYLNSAGVAVMGYYYYDAYLAMNAGDYYLNWYRPYKVEGKWTTLESGSAITVSRMVLQYSSFGYARDYPGCSIDLGDKTHLVSLEVNSPHKATRYSKTSYPTCTYNGAATTYALRYDAPLEKGYGSELMISVVANGVGQVKTVVVLPSAEME